MERRDNGESLVTRYGYSAGRNDIATVDVERRGLI